MRPLPQSPSRDQHFVGFSVGNVRYAVPVQAVREVIMPSEVTELPHTSEAVVGVTNHRGTVIPIVDLRVRFGLPRTFPTGRDRWLLVTLGNALLGLVVDSVGGVFAAPMGANLALPELGKGAEMRGLEGVLAQDGGLVFLLELRSLKELTEGLGDSDARSERLP